MYRDRFNQHSRLPATPLPASLHQIAAEEKKLSQPKLELHLEPSLGNTNQRLNRDQAIAEKIAAMKKQLAMRQGRAKHGFRRTC